MAKHTNLTRYQIAKVNTDRHTYEFLTEPINGFRKAINALYDLWLAKKSEKPSAIYHQDFRIGPMIYRLVKLGPSDRPNPVGIIH